MSLFRRHKRTLIATSITLLMLLAAHHVADRGKMPDWDALCSTEQPYFIAASYRAQSRSDRAPDMAAPSVLLFQDTPSDRVHYKLADFNQVGTVWGLAYRRADRTVFVSAFHKRAMPYGLSGAGGIYRVDLMSGLVGPFVTVPNAGSTGRRSSMSNDLRTYDQSAVRLVGKAALGGLDISDDESQLFVVNLADRRIYRYALPDGKALDSFEVGSAQETWAANGRPFALAFHAGMLYHGVVNDGGPGDDFMARVYRSEADGSNMAPVMTLDLRYARDGVRLMTIDGQTVRWGPWVDPSDTKPGDTAVKHIPQAMLTDIAFAEDGTLVLGLRDRYVDQVVPWVKEEYETSVPGQVDCYNGGNWCTPTPKPPTPAVFSIAEEGLGYGDIVRALPTGDVYDVRADPEQFDDSNAVGHSESAFGGLTCIGGTNQVAATTFGVDNGTSTKTIGKEGVYWYDVKTGSKLSHEVVDQPGSYRDYGDLLKSQLAKAFADNEPTPDQTPVRRPYVLKTRLLFNRDLGSLGDIETLCINCGMLPTPTPLPPSETPVPTDSPTTEPTTVPPSGTPTFTSTPTLTALPPTITSTPLPKPINLPISLLERCDPGHARGDIVLVIDTSSSMEGAKIVAARAAAHEFVRALTLPEDQVGIVSFNATAKVESRLTGNASGLHAAIDQITTAPGTRIDTGLALAIELLAGPDRRVSNTPVVIVMTDGLQAAEPERPQDLAVQLRTMGVVVYAIGLGSDVDAAYLTRLAGDSGRMKLSPTAAELTAIYLEIARLIPCAPSRFWGGR